MQHVSVIRSPVVTLLNQRHSPALTIYLPPHNQLVYLLIYLLLVYLLVNIGVTGKQS